MKFILIHTVGWLLCLNCFAAQAVADDACDDALSVVDTNLLVVDEAAAQRILNESSVTAERAIQTISILIEKQADLPAARLVVFQDEILTLLASQLSVMDLFQISPSLESARQLTHTIEQLRPLKTATGAYRFPQTYTLENILLELKAVKVGIDKEFQAVQSALLSHATYERSELRQISYLTVIFEEIQNELLAQMSEPFDISQKDTYAGIGLRMKLALELLSDHIDTLERKSMDPSDGFVSSDSLRMEVLKVIDIALRTRTQMPEMLNALNGLFDTFAQSLAQGEPVILRLDLEVFSAKVLSFNMALIKRLRTGLLPILAYPAQEEFDVSRWPENIGQDYLDAFTAP